MILSELKNYLADNQRVALLDLSYRFDTDAATLRGMLSLLERKGLVRKLPAGTLCGSGCNNCDAAAIEIYEYVADGNQPQNDISVQAR